MEVIKIFVVVLTLLFSTGTMAFEKDDVCFDASMVSAAAFQAKEQKKRIPFLEKREDLLEAAIMDLGNKYGYHKADSTYDAISTVWNVCKKSFGLN